MKDEAYLVTDTYSSKPDWNGDCDYCIIPVTLKKFAVWKRWMRHVDYMKKNDPEFAELMWLSFVDYAPTYFERTDEIEQFLWEDFDPPTSYYTLVMEEKVQELEKLIEGNEQRVSTPTANAGESAIWHECYVKHTDIQISTPALYDNYLEMAIETLEIENKNKEFLIVTLQDA
jgi:hypothetical protein